jgi:hypothetical protein
MVGASVVAAVDQQAMKARGPHFTELDFLLARAGKGGHAPLKRGRRRQATCFEGASRMAIR